MTCLGIADIFISKICAKNEIFLEKKAAFFSFFKTSQHIKKKKYLQKNPGLKVPLKK